MNVLSLFNGISCGRLALERAGIPVTNYWESEIDPYSGKVSAYNWPQSVQVGCVKKFARYFCAKDHILSAILASQYVTAKTKETIRQVREIKAAGVHLLLAGSPCQGFSFAGKQLNFNDPRSKLFFEFERILKECQAMNPDVLYMLENVPMIKKSQRVINERLGIRPAELNAARVSAQNRVRLFWSNIRTRQDGLFGDVYTDFPEPDDKGILLSHILEDEVDEKYNLSEAALARIERNMYSTPQKNPKKAGNITTKNNSSALSIDSGTTLIGIVNNHGEAREVEKSNAIDANYWRGPVTAGSNGSGAHKNMVKLDVKGKPKANQDKDDCFTAGANSAGQHSHMDVILQRIHGNGKSGDRQISEKSPTATSSSFEQNNFVKRWNGYSKHQQDRVNIGDKSPCIPAQDSNQWTNTLVGSQIRRLTPIEVCRLFTIPDDYLKDRAGKNLISESQQYKALGNGWVVDIIVHIFSFIKLNHT